MATTLHRIVGIALLVLLALPASAAAPVSDDAHAHAFVEDGVVTWSPSVAYVAATLDIRGPEGVTLQRRFEPGQPLALDPSALEQALPDGLYIYDLLFVTGEMVPSAEGEPSQETKTQMGSFEMAGGRAVDSESLPFFHVGSGSIDGSLCVGNDCVSSEAFGFDTIRLKENNLRLHFQDTSVGAFPTNDWTLVANSSASGGDSFF
ncbi:MAG: hypothetical protein HKN41_06270, partial [Ilumatobacter sp.]|nr:hypothetical protein [Ilumatobacter sp.]